MIITVRVIPNSKINGIYKIDGLSYKVKLMEKAEDGKANAALIKLLAEYFGVKKNIVSISTGMKSREKTVHIGIENIE